MLPNASSGICIGNWKKTNPCSRDLAPNRGLPSQHLSMLLVRSYRTFAPLPQQGKSKKLKGILCPFSLFFCLERGGMFLWHYPHGHPHWALPSKFGLSGARTFLRLNREERVRNHLRLLSPSSSLVASCLFFSQAIQRKRCRQQVEEKAPGQKFSSERNSGPS